MLKLYSKLLSQSFQELLMYRLTGVTSVVFGLLFFSIELLTGWLLFSYTDNIIGWSRTDYFLLIITGTLITNGYQMFFSVAHENLAFDILEGNLDYIFIRPVSSFWFYSFFRFDFASLINFIVVLSGLLLIFQQLTVTWGAMLLYFIWLLGSCWFLFLMNHLVVMVTFWYERSTKILGLPEYVTDMTTRPKVIFPQGLAFILTWLSPFLIAINGPVEVLKGQFSYWQLGFFTCYLLILTRMCLIIWQKGLKKYQSTN